MKTVVVLSLALLAVVAADVDLLTTQTIRSKIIEHVNSANTTWVAGVNERFATSTYSDIQRLLGAYEGGPKLPVRNIVADNIPDSFDVRDAWSSCKTVHEVRDQSDCGSCWAFGATEAASDRVCIATNGTKQPRLSAEDLLSCCGSCGMGCSGGFPGSAWDWFTSTGVVTGGAYNDFSWCRAYSLKPCDHHTTGKYGPCPSGLAPTPSCSQQCDSQSSYSVSYSQDKYVFSSAYSVSSDPKAIQTELMTKGSVEAAFTVYADFESYTSGVYQHTTGSQLGGHAVKIVGWGVDNGTPYWTVANSWNTDWGEKGFFRIKRGNDECGIESGIVAGEYK